MSGRQPTTPEKANFKPAVRPHQLELWKVASRDWIKKDHIIKEVPCPLIFDTANIAYPYESTDVFRNETFYTVQILRQASIYTRC